MGFWIFMLVMDLLIPLTMIAFGSYFANNAPKQINPVFGYRTSMSMKNRDTWEFAHHHSGRIWRVTGWIMLVLSAAAMAFVMGKGENAVGIFGGILCGVQLAVLIGTIFPTERALRRTFDERGNRRQ